MPRQDPQQLLKDLGQLHPQEIELLWLIRNVYRFGTIEIVTRDGFPVDIQKTVERVRLGNFSKIPLSTENGNKE